MINSKLISRFQGGIGNQLFEYAASRRLSLLNESELVFDTTTGFERYHKYRRSFQLNQFAVKGRVANNSEMLKPARHIRKAHIHFWDRFKDFSKRQYIRQEFGGFDERILKLKPVTTRWFDGIWNSERYFSDKADIVFNDLQLNPYALKFDISLCNSLKDKNSVAVHFRFFSEKKDYSQNLQEHYYRSAIQYVQSRVGECQFYIFSDNVERARAITKLFDIRAHFIEAQDHKYSALQDLWLMSNCRHIVTANSTFSWWGAWLGEYGQESRLTIVPDPKIFNQPHWTLPDLLPERWIKIGT